MLANGWSSVKVIDQISYILPISFHCDSWYGFNILNPCLIAFPLMIFDDKKDIFRHIFGFSIPSSSYDTTVVTGMCCYGDLWIIFPVWTLWVFCNNIYWVGHEKINKNVG